MKQIFNSLFSINNEFFQQARIAKRITHISLSSFLLPVAFVFISAALTQFIFAPLFFGDPAQASSLARQAFGLYVLFGTAIGIIFLWVHFFEGRPFYTIGFTGNNIFKKYLVGFGSGVIMNSLVVGIIYILGNVEFNSPAPEAGFGIAEGVTIFLFGYIIQGASEEILTRGWMFQVIGSRYKPWLGVLITTILFSLLHSGNEDISIIAIFNLILFALLMTLYVMKDGSIWAACAWHSAWNWTLGNVFGLSVSGTAEKVSIFNLSTSGNEFISGGGFGPEGSVVTTIVLLVAIILISTIIIRRQRDADHRVNAI